MKALSLDSPKNWKRIDVDRLAQYARSVEVPGRGHVESGDDNYRDLCQALLTHHCGPELSAVHHRHQNVEYDEAGYRRVVQIVQRLGAVGKSNRVESLEIEDFYQKPARLIFVASTCP